MYMSHLLRTGVIYLFLAEFVVLYSALELTQVNFSEFENSIEWSITMS
jgi:hypothetical protein